MDRDLTKAARRYLECEDMIRLLEEEIGRKKAVQDRIWRGLSEEEKNALGGELARRGAAREEEGSGKAWTVRKAPPASFHDVAADPSFPLGPKLDMLEARLEQDLKESSLRLDEAYGLAEAAALEQGKPELAKETRTAREMFRKGRGRHFEDRPPLPPLFPEKEAEEQRRRKEGEDAVMKAAAERLGREEDPEERDRLALQALSELLARGKDDEGPWRCCMHGKFRPGRCPYCFRHIRR